MEWQLVVLLSCLVSRWLPPSTFFDENIAHQSFFFVLKDFFMIYWNTLYCLFLYTIRPITNVKYWNALWCLLAYMPLKIWNICVPCIVHFYMPLQIGECIHSGSLCVECVVDIYMPLQIGECIHSGSLVRRICCWYLKFFIFYVRINKFDYKDVFFSSLILWFYNKPTLV